MQLSLKPDIQEHLTRYLAGEMSLNEFRRWVAAIACDIEQSTNQDAANLLYTVELVLAEFSNGDWTEEEVRTLLQPLAKDQSGT